MDKAQREQRSIIGLLHESKDPTRSKVERFQKFEAYSRESEQSYGKYLNTYQARFQADAINFKDELLARLPPSAKTGIAQELDMYEEPKSLVNIATVASDLERLAKGLPSDTQLPSPSTATP